MKHTPGPWAACQTPDTTWLIYDGRGHTVARLTLRWAPAEQEPNAYLIAAAPALLEACEADEALHLHVADCFDCDTGDCETGLQLGATARKLRRAALAQATGADDAR